HRRQDPGLRVPRGPCRRLRGRLVAPARIERLHRRHRARRGAAAGEGRTPRPAESAARSRHVDEATAAVDAPRYIRTVSETEYVVETSGLTKRFGNRTVVKGVELRVPRGVAFGYLGPNGAGKTTLIRMLLGLTRANGGSMRLRGLPVPERRAEALSRVGAIVEEPRFHGHLNGLENLQIVAAARGRDAFGRIEPALQRVGLGHRAGDPVRTYSMGMRQRLGIARCLLA